MKQIYLDNAATSFPKPSGVLRAIQTTMKRVGANPGRGSYPSARAAGRILLETRETLAELFHIPSEKNIAFTLNATEAINLALKGFLRSGDRVVTTSLEHNSVIRPLHELVRSRKIQVETVPCPDGKSLDLAALKRALQKPTRLVVCVHASNVCGTILPLRRIGQLARTKGAALLLDAAQSAGVLPIDVVKDQIDFLCAPGHKGLLGPQGTGFLYFRDGMELRPLMEGGTGSQSDRPEMPKILPDRFQAGTPNTPGIAGLKEGVRFVRNRLSRIREKEMRWAELILDSLGSMEKVVLYGPSKPESRVSVISFNISNMDPAEVGNWLEQRFGVSCRVGLHCAPSAHRSIGTFPEGTVRVSPGYFTTRSEIRSFISAVESMVMKHGKRKKTARKR